MYLYHRKPEHLEKEIISQIIDMVYANSDSPADLTVNFHEKYNLNKIKISNYVHPEDYCGPARLEFLCLYAEKEVYQGELSYSTDYWE